MKEQKTALVFGASGLVGRRLTKLLLLDDNWSTVRTVTRRPMNLNSSKLIQITADSESLLDVESDLVADTVFCCLGTTQRQAGSQAAFKAIDHDYVLECARLSKGQGARRFVFVSSVGASEDSPNFYTQIKGRVEKGLQELGFESLILLRPALLLGERAGSRPLEQAGGAILPLFSPLMLGPLKKYRPIEASKVAAAMAVIGSRDHQGVMRVESDELATY